jgi:nucleoside-diphosphate-sugar epimerase
VVRNLRDVDAVVHLAALTFVPPSWENPGAYMKVNYEGTVNFLENHRLFDYFVYFSTSHIMGDQKAFPIAVESEPAPMDPYSLSKKAATDAVKLYSRRFGFRSLIVRPYNSFGPRQSKNFVIPTMVLQALRKGSITLHGDTQKEFVYVKDDAKAVRGFLDRGLTGTVQICKGESYKVSDVGRMILRETGLDESRIEVLPTDRPAWDIQKLEGDPSSLYEALPAFTFTPMEQAIRETVEWYRRDSAEREGA